MKKIPVSFFIHKNNEGSFKSEHVTANDNFYGLYGTESVDVIITERDDYYVKADVIMVNDVNANDHLCEIFVKWDDQVNVTMDDYMNDKENLEEIGHLLKHVASVLCRYVERYDEIEDVVVDPKWNGYFYTGKSSESTAPSFDVPKRMALPVPVQSKTWMDVILGVRKHGEDNEPYIGLPDRHVLVSSKGGHAEFRRLLTDWLHLQRLCVSSRDDVHVYVDNPHSEMSAPVRETCMVMPNTVPSLIAALRLTNTARVEPVEGDFAISDTSLYFPNLSGLGNKMEIAQAHSEMEKMAANNQSMMQMARHSCVSVIRGATENSTGGFHGVPERLRFVSSYALHIRRATKVSNGHYVEVEVTRNQTGPSGIVGSFFVPTGCKALTANMMNFGAACRFTKLHPEAVPVAVLPGYGDVTWEEIEENEEEYTYALWAMASFNQARASFYQTYDLPNPSDWNDFVADKDYCRTDFTYRPIESVDMKESFLGLLGSCSLWHGGIENASVYSKQEE